MTPAPKDAPVEPDFARLAQEYMERIHWPNWQDYCGYVADAMEEAFAAGRQAAPQNTPQHLWSDERKADEAARQQVVSPLAIEVPKQAEGGREFADKVAEEFYSGPCDWLQEMVAGHDAAKDARIAEMEVALRDLLNSRTDVKAGWCDRGLKAAAHARDLLTPTSGAASGKGKGEE